MAFFLFYPYSHIFSAIDRKLGQKSEQNHTLQMKTDRKPLEIFDPLVRKNVLFVKIRIDQWKGKGKISIKLCKYSYI